MTERVPDDAGELQALRDRVAELEALLQIVPVGLAIATNGDASTIRSNPYMAEMLGVDLEANISLSVPAAQRPGFRLRREGRDIPPAELPLQQVVESGIAMEGVDLEVVRPDGHVRHIRGNVAPLLDERGEPERAAGAFWDVTESVRAEAARQAAEEQLRSSEEWYQALMEHNFDAIVLVDATGVITYASPSTLRVFGFTPQELCGRSAFEFIHPEDIPGAQAKLGEVLQRPGARVASELRIQHRSGSLLWIEVAGHNLLHDPRVGGVFSNFHDITKRKQAEEELRAADERKDQFLAMLSHELRNPLTPIRGALELVRLDQENGIVRQGAIEVLDRQVGALTRLVDDLLDVSRVTTGRIQLQRTDVDVGALVQTVADSFRPQIGERRQELSLSLDVPGPWAHADPMRLEQVVVNLLSNATRYTPDGGRVSISVGRTGDQPEEAVIRVQDDGMGIEPALLPHIFDLFSQGERGLDRADSGLGIGLALVRSLADLHGGNVTASSEGPGRGSEFVIRLPAVRAPDGLQSGERTTGKEGRRAGAPGTPGIAGLRVAVADDNPDTVRMLAMILRVRGYDVQAITGDGSTILQAIVEARPDVVILDIGLPGMDGYEVARRIRQDQSLRGIVLAGLSGYSQEEHRRRSREAGFDYHLVKPQGLAELQGILESVRRRGETETDRRG